MPHICAVGMALIMQFEQFCATVYECPAGLPTIGYGHVVRASEWDEFRLGIRRQRAEELLL
ncbi:glycoside hydrolase family protein [Tahibacter amnicola]|uniref:Lysozyme n=1 Tax=Tahibacter amnicola TaxID=2976241 RepID=A0ABY6BBY7_9GAMM|nr:hypothetical protein [Tahibacter amnicola]UXI66146.1 hypothetical protein N4264_15465 [Tahibacter amnicola]